MKIQKKKQHLLWTLWITTILLILVFIVLEKQVTKKRVEQQNTLYETYAEHEPGKTQGYFSEDETGDKQLSDKIENKAEEFLNKEKGSEGQNPSTQQSPLDIDKNQTTETGQKGQEGTVETKDTDIPGEQTGTVTSDGQKSETETDLQETSDTEIDEQTEEKDSSIIKDQTTQEMLPKPAKRTLDKEKPMIAMTFDDGPYRNNTRAIVDLFSQYDQRATFFVVGYHVEAFYEEMKYAYQKGFQIGNHTLNHPQLTKKTDQEILDEVNGLNNIINQHGISGNVMLRPPYGDRNEFMKENLSVPMIGWNVDSEDWKSKNEEKIYNKIVGKVKDGDIVLMHDLHEETAKAMETIVPALIEQGFQLVTIEEMFEAKGIEPVAGEYYYNIR